MNIHFITTRPYSDKKNKDDLDRLDHFLYEAQQGQIDGWSARKTFEPGDLAIFYFAQPKMTLEAVAYVDSDPYVEEIDSWADFSNPVFCDFSPALILDNEVPIKDVIAREPIIAEWWKTKSYQGIRRIDEDVALVLLQGIVENNPNDLEALDTLINYLSTVTTGTPPQPAATTAPTPVSPTKAQPKAQAKKKKWTSRDFMRLSWLEFEVLVAELFSHMHKNATVELTAATADHGVDVIITDNKTRDAQIVQCKRFRPDNKVSSVDMQKFAGAMKKFNATRGYFVTSSSFNPYALKFVDGMDDIELIEGKKLVRMINKDDKIPSRDEFRRK